MFEQEFEATLGGARQHHRDLLTDELKYGSLASSRPVRDPRAAQWRNATKAFGIHGLIFFQRPLYWPKSVVGQCELEPQTQRMPRADRLGSAIPSVAGSEQPASTSIRRPATSTR